MRLGCTSIQLWNIKSKIVSNPIDSIRYLVGSNCWTVVQKPKWLIIGMIFMKLIKIAIALQCTRTCVSLYDFFSHKGIWTRLFHSFIELCFAVICRLYLSSVQCTFLINSLSLSLFLFPMKCCVFCCLIFFLLVLLIFMTYSFGVTLFLRVLFFLFLVHFSRICRQL